MHKNHYFIPKIKDDLLKDLTEIHSADLKALYPPRKEQIASLPIKSTKNL